MVGTIELERPYFYCLGCREGTYPLDEVLDVSAGRIQRDVQQAAVDLATEVPYERASTLLSRLSGMTVSSERMHTITHQVAAGLRVVEVAPAREEIERRVGPVAAGRFRRPVLVLGIDGAYVPSRGYPLKVGQWEDDCRYSTMHGMSVTGGRGFRSLKPLWYNGVPP